MWTRMEISIFYAFDLYHENSYIEFMFKILILLKCICYFVTIPNVPAHWIKWGPSNPYQILSFGEEQLFDRLFLVASFCVNEMSLKVGT